MLCLFAFCQNFSKEIVNIEADYFNLASLLLTNALVVSLFLFLSHIHFSVVVLDKQFFADYKPINGLVLFGIGLQHRCY